MCGEDLNFPCRAADLSVLFAGESRPEVKSGESADADI